jgi:hypothetical protein
MNLGRGIFESLITKDGVTITLIDMIEGSSCVLKKSS